MKPVLCAGSILLRLFNLFPYHFNPISTEFCISGQNINSLKRLLKDKRGDIKHCKVILMIGTNDFKNSAALSYCKTEIKSLVKLLSRLRSSIFTCEIPPFATEMLSSSYNSGIVDFNKFIHSMSDVTKVLKTHSIFVTESEINLHLYCRFYGSSTRTDLIHPNHEGLVAILELILSEL